MSVVGFGALGRACGPSVTAGVLSAVVAVAGHPVMLQSTCAVHGGSSGGPLVSSRSGCLMGEPGSALGRWGGPMGVPPLRWPSLPPLQGSWPATPGTPARGPPTPTSTSASPSRSCSPSWLATATPETPMPSPGSTAWARACGRPGSSSSGQDPPASSDPRPGGFVPGTEVPGTEVPGMELFEQNRWSVGSLGQGMWHSAFDSC